MDVDAITSVVADLSSSDEDLAQESIQLFDAFNAPKLYFDEKFKSHRLIAPAAYHLLSTSEMRADMYRQRLLFTQQRLLRSERFALKGMGPSSKPSGTVHDISTIESLLGSSGIKVLLGMLTQPEEGSWFLEDLVSMIRLDLSRAQTFSGFLTEGSQVIVQGELRTGTFSVEVRCLMQQLLLTDIDHTPHTMMITITMITDIVHRGAHDRGAAEVPAGSGHRRYLRQRHEASADAAHGGDGSSR